MPCLQAGLADRGGRLRRLGSASGAVRGWNRAGPEQYLGLALPHSSGRLAQGAGGQHQGQALCNEQAYGAKLGYEMMEKQGGKAWLIIDSSLRRQATWQCLFGGLWAFQSVPALALMYKVAIKGRSVADLACKIGADAALLQRQFDAANAAARGEIDDPMGKSRDLRHEFKGGSLFAIDISIHQKMFPLAVLSLGGLKINEDSGAVVDGAGRDIPGLYAAGRTAIGVASSRYVSGLSLADCVFSGRRAGKAAALADAPPSSAAATALRPEESLIV